MEEIPAEVGDAIDDIIEGWTIDILTKNVALEYSASSSSSSSSDDDCAQRTKRVRIEDFVELTVPSYSDVEFKNHFRLRRQEVYHLIRRFRTTEFLPVHSFGRKKVSHQLAFLMTLWYLSNLETFRQCSDRFNVSFSSSHRILIKTLNFITSLRREYIQWPDLQRADKIRESFRQKHDIDCIIGAIDGSHIEIRRFMKDEEVYVNRKGYHSIILQAIVDSRKRFIDIYAGEPGSLHDARVLRRSPIYRNGMGDPNFFHGNFILGDSAYPSLPWLVPPFKDNGHLTENEKIFNYRHSSSRIVVENAFADVKNKMRRLLRFDNLKIKIVVKCVMAACILHNISLMKDPFNANEDAATNREFNRILGNNMHPHNVDRRTEVFNKMFNE